jgi:hypothetical protein
MAEIDRLRAELADARATRRNPSRWPRIHGDEAHRVVEAQESQAEAAVEAALREWWAQDCREPTT